jgi:hypothetical protein
MATSAATSTMTNTVLVAQKSGRYAWDSDSPMVLELGVSAKPALLADRFRIVAPGAKLFSNGTP